jgi:serine/threonine protein kinase/Flp pilus assembly protein TadD
MLWSLSDSNRVMNPPASEVPSPTAVDGGAAAGAYAHFARFADVAFGDQNSGATSPTSRHLAMASADALLLDLADPRQRRLGDYELLELVGEGGMGVVYRARQVSLDREVAVKVLAAGPWASREFIERFQREAQNAARMQHAHIVAIHEVGSAEELHFYSMRLVRGETLADVLRREGRLPALRAAALLIPIAEAIDYAHSLGVLHLDLKPANVLIDEHGIPHVADFGLARRLERELAVSIHEICGTPSYMAPEQAAAGQEKISFATDVWGLGAILYELVTGQPPFLAESPQATLKLVLEGAPRPARSHVPSLPRDLDAIIEKCMVRDVSVRYATAAALADDLRAFVGGRPVTARALNPLQRIEHWVRRERKLAIAAGLAGIGLLIGIAATMQQLPIAAISDKSVAVLPFENLSRDPDNAYFVDGIQDEILTRLAKISALKVISRTSTQHYAAKPGNLAEIARQLGVANILEGTVQRDSGTVRVNVQLIAANSDSHLWADSYDRDIKNIFSVESEVAQSVADALKAKLLPAESVRIASVPTKNPEAYDRFLRAEYFARYISSDTTKDPVDTVRKAKDLYISAVGADPDFALAYAQLSRLLAQAYFVSIDSSQQTIDAARVAAEHALALQPDLPEAHLAMGYVHYWGHRDYAAALTEFTKARASLPNNANVIMAFAYVHRRQGNLLQAISEIEQAVALDPRDPTLPQELGYMLVFLRRYAEAETAFDRALAMAPDNIFAHLQRAAALQMSGDLDGSSRALAAISADYDPQGTVSLGRFEFALATRQPEAALAAIAKAPALLRNNVDNFLTPVMLLRAQALARKGDVVAAHAAFLEAQQALDGLSNEALDQAAGTGSNRAIVYAGLGQNDAALAAGRRATDLLPVSHDVLVGVFYLTRLAKIEAQVGETDAALKHIEQLLTLPAGYEVSTASLRTDPVWDPLRDDPRFQKLIADSEAAVAAQGKP